MRIMKVKADAHELDSIDDRLTRCLNEMQTALHVHTVELQHMSFEELSRANAAIASKIDEISKQVHVP